jgi:hypothetical protein
MIGPHNDQAKTVIKVQICGPRDILCFSQTLQENSDIFIIFNFNVILKVKVKLILRLAVYHQSILASSQGRYLHTGHYKHRIKAYTDIHVMVGILTHDPIVRASENS